MEFKYSAGMTSHATWNAEFISYISLLQQGKTHKDIAELSKNSNIFLASGQARAQRTYGVLNKRVSSLSQQTIDQFENLDLSDQKLVNLITIMKTERIFKEFMQEVYMERRYETEAKLTPFDFMHFFELKSHQSSQVASWTNQSVKRLTGTFKVLLVETGIAEKNGQDRKITPPILSRALKSSFPIEDYPYLKVLGGEQ